MQCDFHYYCIAVLAKISGFSTADALTIAYASQYVDNSTEGDQIQIGTMKFDPVRTAHIGLDATIWDIQKKIIIPFHFLPPKNIRTPDDTFVTSTDSDLANTLFQRACNEKDPLLRLCRIGVALHTIADTTSHQFFSGREDPENKVDDICLFNGTDYDHLSWQNIFYDLLPPIGHAQAAHYPDLPYQKWHYKNNDGQMISRNNPYDFLLCANRIYKILCTVSDGTKQEWNDYEDRIQALLEAKEGDLDKRCELWQNEFASLFPLGLYNYDMLAWRKTALQTMTNEEVHWDKQERSKTSSMKFDPDGTFFTSHWVHFHRAALMQRNYVLEQIL